MGFKRYDSEGNVIRKRVTIDCQKAIKDGEEVRVEQSHKDEVNINNIVRKHGLDLIVRVQALQQFQYDDVTGNDFQESMNAIIKARDTFSSVPSDIRKQFDNDPAKFMDFVHNPENHDAMVEMGLANKPVVQAPIEVLVTNPLETPTAEP